MKVAEAASVLAEQAAGNLGGRGALGHVVLLVVMLPHLRDFGYRPRLGESVTRWCFRHPALAYLGSLSLLTALIVASLSLRMYRHGGSTATLIATVLLALIPASDIALSILNWDVTNLFKPRLLPRMNTAKGIGASGRTMVVIPTIFSSEAGVHELLERLEVHFLANQDEHLHYALLGDFADAPAEHMPEDAALLTLPPMDLNEQSIRKTTATFHLVPSRPLWIPETS